MTAPRSVRLSAAATVLVVTALVLGTGHAEAGSGGNVHGVVTCNRGTGQQSIAWNYSSNGAAGTIDSAAMSGAATGAVTMSPAALTAQSDEANGTAVVGGSVTGAVTLTVNFTPNNLPQ